jgi:hypothetical protein
VTGNWNWEKNVSNFLVIPKSQGKEEREKTGLFNNGD